MAITIARVGNVIVSSCAPGRYARSGSESAWNLTFRFIVGDDELGDLVLREGNDGTAVNLRYGAADN